MGGAIAIQAGKDYAKLTENTMYHALTLIRFGRFDEVAAVARPEKSTPRDRAPLELSGSLWDFATAYAKLREGDVESASATAEALLELAGETEARFRFGPASQTGGRHLA